MTGPDGATHQSTEDIALTRTLPGMTVFSPCDVIEAKKTTLEAAKIFGPVYLRFTEIKLRLLLPQTPFDAHKFKLSGQVNS